MTNFVHRNPQLKTTQCWHHCGKGGFRGGAQMGHAPNMPNIVQHDRYHDVGTGITTKQIRPNGKRCRQFRGQRVYLVTNLFSRSCSACWKRFCSLRTSAISALDVSRRCALQIYILLSYLLSEATQLSWGWKLCIHLEARNVRILYAKNYEDRFELLLVTEANLADILWDTRYQTKAENQIWKR